MTRLGTIEQAGGKHVLRYERSLEHPVERVWAALTEPDELRQWLAAADELELTEGGAIALRWLNVPESREQWEEQGVEMPEGHDPSAPIRGTVTRLEPRRLIEYETDSLGVMRWELRAEGAGSVLTFTNTIELPAGQPPEQTLAGWHIHLDHLEEVLAGGRIDWANWTDTYMESWSEIRERYAGAVR